MAVNANRIRRALSLSTSFMNLHKHRLPSISSTHSLLQNLLSSPSQIYPRRRFVHSTNIVHYSSRSFNVDKIDPDTILFEGCDYKHWLIVMDFGKDPDQRPPPEQMVETYVQTLAKVVGSVEEAKKKIYACSTTTYTGFQAEIDEETSKKLEDLPGVIFVLPDSYIDPVNKEYGGDKYINGTIIPRPPPVQYGRRRDRQLDQRPRSPMPNQQEGRGYRPQNDFADRGKFPPNSGPTGSNKDSYQSGENAYVSPQGNHNHNMPPHQGNYNHNPPPHQGNYNQNVPPHQGNLNYNVPPHQGNYNHGMPPQGNYNHGMPPHQGNYNHGMPPQGNYNHGMPPHQGNHNHGMPPHQQNYNPGYTHPHQMKNLSGDYSSNAPLGHINDPRGDQLYNNSQGPMTNIPGQHYGHTPQGQMQYPGDGTNHSPSPVRGPGGQTGVGSFEQTGTGQYGQMPGGYEQGASTRNGHGYTSQVESQRFSAAPDQHNSTPTDYINVSPPQPGMNQRKF